MHLLDNSGTLQNSIILRNTDLHWCSSITSQYLHIYDYMYFWGESSLTRGVSSVNQKSHKKGSFLMTRHETWKGSKNTKIKKASPFCKPDLICVKYTGSIFKKKNWYLILPWKIENSLNLLRNLCVKHAEHIGVVYYLLEMFVILFCYCCLLVLGALW